MSRKNIEALRLKKFDMKMVRDDSVIVGIGRRRSGKSWLIADLLYYKSDIPAARVFSGTEKANKFFGNIIPECVITNKWDPKKFDNFFKRQEDLKEKKMNDPSFKFCDNRGILILDDLMYDSSWLNHKTVLETFMNGRHYDILFIVTLQYCLGMKPAARGNVDFAFIFKENIIQNRKRLYDSFAGMFPSFESFSKTMDKYTEDFGCLVINFSTRSNNIYDQVFFYKAEQHEDFKCCDPQLWELSEKMKNKKH